MPGGIRVDLVPLGRLDVSCPLEQLGSQRDDLVVGCLDIIDEQVEVDLLRSPIRPVRRNMAGCARLTRMPRSPRKVS